MMDHDFGGGVPIRGRDRNMFTDFESSGWYGATLLLLHDSELSLSRDVDLHQLAALPSFTASFAGVASALGPIRFALATLFCVSLDREAIRFNRDNHAAQFMVTVLFAAFPGLGRARAQRKGRDEQSQIS